MSGAHGHPISPRHVIAREGRWSHAARPPVTARQQLARWRDAVLRVIRARS